MYLDRQVDEITEWLDTEYRTRLTQVQRWSHARMRLKRSQVARKSHERLCESTWVFSNEMDVDSVADTKQPLLNNKLLVRQPPAKDKEGCEQGQSKHTATDQ